MQHGTRLAINRVQQAFITSTYKVEKKMKNIPNKKSILLATILASGISLAITQAAIAKPNWHGQGGNSPCQARQMDTVTQKAHEKFLQDTTELRKQMMEKRASMRAVMAAETPDPAKASKIAGELFDLREQLRIKAQEYGLPAVGMGFHGAMMGCDGKKGMRGKWN